MRIVFLPSVLDYFNELTTLLYEKEYFGFLDSAVRYVDDLLEDIRQNLPTKLHKSAPPYFNRYGRNMLYATFRKSKATQWYVFFSIYRKDDELIYLVRHISNNHVAAQYL